MKVIRKEPAPPAISCDQHSRNKLACSRGRFYFGCAVGIAIATGGTGARAAETVIPVTPPGATDVDQALLPPVSGLYGGLVVIPFAQNANTYDSSGHALPASRSLNVNVDFIVPALLYVYPFKLFGGSLGSTFIQPFERLDYSIGSNYSSRQTGVADAYSDVIYWSKSVGLAGATPGRIPMPYGLSVGGGLALIVPDGHYNPHVPLNDSSNIWVLDPNAAVTYNTGPRLSLGDNTQLSARVFYGNPLENPATKYQSGNVLDVDWSTTQQFGRLRLGVAGFYETQLTADRPGNGLQLPNGNRFTASAAGPVVEFFLPKLGTFLKAKYQYTFYHRNTVDQQVLVLTVGFKF